jgi:hypothetical protein
MVMKHRSKGKGKNDDRDENIAIRKVPNEKATNGNQS